MVVKPALSTRRTVNAHSILAGMVLLVSATTTSAQTSPESIVERFYPLSLQTADQNVLLKPERGYCHEVLATNGRQATAILAVYTNRSQSVAIRVLKQQPDSSFFVAWESSDEWFLRGGPCEIERIRHEGLQLEDFLVSLSDLNGRSSYDWVLHWSGNRLVNLGPAVKTELGSLQSELSNVYVRDADNSGNPKLFSGRDPIQVFARTTGGYERLQDIELGAEFLQRDTAPYFDESYFGLDAVNAAGYTLRIVNGIRDGSRRSASTIISINGILIAPTSMFGEAVAGFTLPIPPGVLTVGDNTVKLEMNDGVNDRVFVEVIPNRQ